MRKLPCAMQGGETKAVANALAGLVAPVFGPERVGRIADALGVAPDVARTLIRAATPAVLAAFSAKAATPDGAQTIAGLAAGEASDLIGRIERIGDGGKADEVIAEGTAMLATCLGSETITALARALASFTGAPEQAGASALALVTATLVGALGRLPQGEGKGAAGVARLFAPPAPVPPPETQAKVLPDPVEAAEPAASPVPDRRGDWRGGLAVLAGVIAIVAGLGYVLYPRESPVPPSAPVAPPAEPAVVAPKPVPEAVPPPAPSSDALRIIEHLAATLLSLGSALDGISDVASAKAAQLKLAAVAADLDMLGDQLSALPQQGLAQPKAGLSASAALLAEKLRTLLAQPDTAGVLRPVVEPLLLRLDSLARP